MVSYIKKIIIITFLTLLACILIVFSVTKEKNVALNKKVIGTVENLKFLTDGVIKKQNYIEIKDMAKYDQYFIVVLGQAKYINSIKLYWVKGFLPSLYRVEASKSLFKWDKIGDFTIKKFTEKDGLLITKHKFKSRAAFFIKVSILKSKSKIIRLCEVELFPEIGVKLNIKNQKVINIQEHSAEIIFYTTSPSTGYLRFGESLQNLSQNIGMEMDIFSEHKVYIGNLLKGTVYYYQPVVRDLSGNSIVGEAKSFKTKGIPLPRYLTLKPQEIVDFNAALKWDLNVPCKSKLFLGTSEKKLKECYNNNNMQTKNTVKIKKLIPETTFYYKIISTDKFNNKVEESGDFQTKAHNIALNKRTYGTFFYPPEGRGKKEDIKFWKKITDGNNELNGHTGSGDLSKKDQVAIIDLGKKYRIRNVHVIWRGIAYSRHFDVYIGNDLKKWKLVKAKLDSKKDGKKILSKGSYGLFLRLVSVNIKGQEARYVKINVPKGTASATVGSDLPFDTTPFLQLTEIEVFKVPDYGPPQYMIEKIK